MNGLLGAGAIVAEEIGSQIPVAPLLAFGPVCSPRYCICTAKLIKAGPKSLLRVLRLPDKLLDLLRAQMGRCRGDHLFPANGSLAHLFDRILARADIAKIDELGRKLTAHSFRHTFATLQASAVSFNPFLLKEILGHQQLSTTDRYCHARSVAAVIDVSDLLGGVRGRCDAENETAGEQSPAAGKPNIVSA